MCSDGVCNDPEADEDPAAMQLIEFLEHEYLQDVNKIAENILFDASRVNGRTDDMTVGVFRVRQKWKKKKTEMKKTAKSEIF